MLPTGTLGSFTGYFKKNISLSITCGVDEMVREVRARQEIADSNPSYSALIFLFDESLRHRLFYPMPKAPTFGLGYGVPV